MKQRLFRFRRNTMFNSIFICSSCQRYLFECNVTKFTTALHCEIETKNPGLYERVVEFSKTYKWWQHIKYWTRTPAEAGLIEVDLKRKVEYKNSHTKKLIDPEKCYKMLESYINSQSVCVCVCPNFVCLSQKLAKTILT